MIMDLNLDLILSFIQILVIPVMGWVIAEVKDFNRKLNDILVKEAVDQERLNTIKVRQERLAERSHIHGNEIQKLGGRVRTVEKYCKIDP